MKENGPLLSILLTYKNQVLWNMNKAKDEGIIFRTFPNPYYLWEPERKYGIFFICSKKNTKMIVKNSEH